MTRRNQTDNEGNEEAQKGNNNDTNNQNGERDFVDIFLDEIEKSELNGDGAERGFEFLHHLSSVITIFLKFIA